MGGDGQEAASCGATRRLTRGRDALGAAFRRGRRRRRGLRRMRGLRRQRGLRRERGASIGTWSSASLASAHGQMQTGVTRDRSRREAAVAAGSATCLDAALAGRSELQTAGRHCRHEPSGRRWDIRRVAIRGPALLRFASGPIGRGGEPRARRLGDLVGRGPASTASRACPVGPAPRAPTAAPQVRWRDLSASMISEGGRPRSAHSTSEW